MATTVVTGWHPPGYREYAHTFVETFHRHWPADVNLLAYTEEPAHMPRGECRSLWDIEGAREFYERNKVIPAHCGRAPTRHWRAKDVARLANGVPAYRWDAVRFFKQLIIPEHASRDLPDGDTLVWLDADVVTFADVPENFVEKMLGSADLCYLGRGKGSEIGFWAVRLNNRSREFLRDISSMYLDDRAFALSQWDSAFVWDHARKAASGLASKDLTPGGREHVWMECVPLYSVCDHLKGGRKAKGYSPEHPLRWWERKA